MGASCGSSFEDMLGNNSSKTPKDIFIGLGHLGVRHSESVSKFVESMSRSNALPNTTKTQVEEKLEEKQTPPQQPKVTSGSIIYTVDEEYAVWIPTSGFDEKLEVATREGLEVLRDIIVHVNKTYAECSLGFCLVNPTALLFQLYKSSRSMDLLTRLPAQERAKVSMSAVTIFRHMLGIQPTTKTTTKPPPLKLTQPRTTCLQIVFNVFRCPSRRSRDASE